MKHRVPLLLLFAFGVSTLLSAGQPAADLVVVEKARRTLTVFSGNTAVRTYSVALGPNPKGHKVQAGDGRTPEGRYTIDYKNEKSAYYLALHISYPNQQDILEAKRRGVSPGGDIMVHGLPNGVGAVGQGEDWTRGCIAVTNEEIEEIARLVPPGTPIEIRP